jgi:hypothetical protein
LGGLKFFVAMNSVGAGVGAGRNDSQRGRLVWVTRFRKGLSTRQVATQEKLFLRRIGGLEETVTRDSKTPRSQRESGNCPMRPLTLRSMICNELRLVNTVKRGSVCKLLVVTEEDWNPSTLRFDRLSELKLRSNVFRLDREAKDGGRGPMRSFPERLKKVREGKFEKISGRGVCEELRSNP